MEYKKPYIRGPRQHPTHGGESMTQQHFKDEADINNIVKQSQQTGFLVSPFVRRSGQPIFDDFSQISDYKTMLDYMGDVQAQFMSDVPPHIRAMFGNDWRRFYDFCQDPANRDKLVELGLMPKIRRDHDDKQFYVDKDGSIVKDEQQSPEQVPGSKV